MTAKEILDKHWREFQLAVGMEPHPMTPRAEEHLLRAMEEYANQRPIKEVKDVYGLMNIPSRELYKGMKVLLLSENKTLMYDGKGNWGNITNVYDKN